MLLIDAKQLLTNLPSDAFASLPESFERDLDGFDALIYLRDAPTAPSNIMPQKERAFRKSLLASLTSVLIPLGLLATGIIALGRFLFRMFTKRVLQDSSTPIWPGLLLPCCASFALVVIGMQLNALRAPLATHPATLTSPNTLVWIAGLGSVLVIVSAIVAWQRGWWSRYWRVHFTVLSLAAGGLVLFMYHWNLGGMLGRELP